MRRRANFEHFEFIGQIVRGQFYCSFWRSPSIKNKLVLFKGSWRGKMGFGILLFFATRNEIWGTGIGILPTENFYWEWDSDKSRIGKWDLKMKKKLGWEMGTIPPPGSRPSFYLLFLSNIFVSDIEMKCSSSGYGNISKSIIIMTLLARWTYPRQLIILLSVKGLLISGWMVTK